MFYKQIATHSSCILASHITENQFIGIKKLWLKKYSFQKQLSFAYIAQQPRQKDTVTDYRTIASKVNHRQNEHP